MEVYPSGGRFYVSLPGLAKAEWNADLPKEIRDPADCGEAVDAGFGRRPDRGFLPIARRTRARRDPDPRGAAFRRLPGPGDGHPVRNHPIKAKRSS